MKTATEIKDKREFAQAFGGEKAKYVQCECGYEVIAKNETYECSACHDKVIVK